MAQATFITSNFKLQQVPNELCIVIRKLTQILIKIHQKLQYGNKLTSGFDYTHFSNLSSSLICY